MVGIKCGSGEATVAGHDSDFFPDGESVKINGFFAGNASVFLRHRRDCQMRVVGENTIAGRPAGQVNPFIFGKGDGTSVQDKAISVPILTEHAAPNKSGTIVEFTRAQLYLAGVEEDVISRSDLIDAFQVVHGHDRGG